MTYICITHSHSSVCPLRSIIVTPWSVSPVPVIVSTPLQVSPIFPIIPCIFIPVFSDCPLPVCHVNQRLFTSPAFPSLSFSRPPGFDPCLSWLWAHLPYHSAWACLPTCTFAPPLYCLTFAYPEPACRSVPLPHLLFTDPCLPWPVYCLPLLAY
jgi:hypothetical protein